MFLVGELKKYWSTATQKVFSDREGGENVRVC